MTIKKIILEFKILPGIERPVRNGNELSKIEMVKWCMDHKMNVKIENDLESSAMNYYVIFYEDKTTQEFIERFLRPKEGSILSLESLKKIPSARVIE